MEFTAYLDTKNNYDPNDVIITFHKILELGMKELTKRDNKLDIEIANDIYNNSPIIERT